MRRHRLRAMLLRMENEVAAHVRLRVAVTSATESLGPHHPETGRALLALGAAAQRAGELDEAEVAYRRGTAILQTQPVPDQVALGVACADLAALLVQRGRLTDAGPALARAEALLERALGAEHPDVAAIRARRRTLEAVRQRIPY